MKKTKVNFVSSLDAEKNIEYLDGTPYAHIENIAYNFDEGDETDCITFHTKSQLNDIACDVPDGRKVMCEYKYDCPGELIKTQQRNIKVAQFFF